MSQLTTNPEVKMPKTEARQIQSVADATEFANLLDTGKFDHLWRVATLFSKSSLVPEHFRGKTEDCFIAAQMAVRLGVDPFMFMQNTYVVHGRPGMEAKLAIALMNTGGIFANGVEYESIGEDPMKNDYGVRAYGVRLSTGKTVFGPWITWDLVRKEGWDKKAGSKWQTIPSQMFHYRAATFFGRLYCPERLMGMSTADELEDMGETHTVQATVMDAPKGSAGLKAKLAALDATPAESPTTPQDEPAAETPVTTPEPEKPAQGQPAAPAEALKALRDRYLKPTLFPANKGEKAAAIDARFLTWINISSQIEAAGLEAVTDEQVSRCNVVLSDLEESAP